MRIFLEGAGAPPELSIEPYLVTPLQSRVSNRGAVEYGDIKRAFVSYPELFKHLAFDGGFLHGVPEELLRTLDDKEGDGTSTDQVEGSGTRNCSRSSAATSPSVDSKVSAPWYARHS